MSYKLVAKFNTFDVSKFVLKPQYNTDKSNSEKKIDDADKKIYPILVELLKIHIIMLRSLKVKAKYLVLPV